MSDELNERDADGNLTDWALACDALQDAGCDCGEDEPGTCLAHRCEKAMRTERAEVERLRARKDATVWEEDHQRAALERHGLMDLYAGCDSIDAVCERLVAARTERDALGAEVRTLRNIGVTQAEEIERLRNQVGVAQLQWAEERIAKLEVGLRAITNWVKRNGWHNHPVTAMALAALEKKP